MTVRLRRSALYVPATNMRALEKARGLPSDVIIIDLEDSVAPGEKDEARRQAIKALSEGGFAGREVAVRVNGLNTPWGARDLAEVVTSKVDAIVVPKVSSVSDLLQIRNALGERAGPQIWAMLETPAAMLRALDIAEGGRDVLPALSLLVIGTNDLAKDSRAVLKPGRSLYLPWLMSCVAAARAAGLDILDGVFNDFRDEPGFEAECQQGREMGMDGKTLIHPGQIAAANRIFAPTPEEIAWAGKVCATFDDPRNAAAGVVSIEGRMVERLHAEMARRVLEMARSL